MLSTLVLIPTLLKQHVVRYVVLWEQLLAW